MELAGAIKAMIGKAAGAAGKFVNYLVQQGKIGVWRRARYFATYDFWAADQYKIHLGGVNRAFKEGKIMWNPENAVAYGLWLALRNLPGVEATHTDTDRDIGSEPRYGYWVGPDEG